MTKRRTTKEILGDSFRDLARRKLINKITIADITENCGLSPPTFYNHFHDKFDLMTWIYVTQCQRVMERIGHDGYQWRDTLVESMRYLSGHRDELLNAFTHTSGREAFISRMMNINVGLLTTEVRKKLLSDSIPGDILLMIKIYCYGTVAYICEWVVDNMPVPPDAAADAMERSLPEPLKPFLYP